MNLLKRIWITRQLRRRFYSWDLATLRRHQTERVADILAFARQNSPYYADLISKLDKLEDVPIIDKAIMMDNFNQINTAGLKRDALVDFQIGQERDGSMELYDGGYSIGLSSGTSGNRGLTVLSRAERELYGCLIWARSGIPRMIAPIRLLFTLRTNNAAFMEPKSLGLKIVFADYTHSADEIVRLINEKRINVFAGPPSLLRMVAAHVGAIANPLKAIISYAEVLDIDAKAELEKAFGTSIIQIYQGSEGFIASTCRKGNLHINEDTILVQEEGINDPDDAVKNIILTDLYRHTQPIIRYRLGDLLEFDPTSCACGSVFRCVKVIHGRSDDIFHLTAKDGTTRYLFPDYVRRAINQASGAIIEYQAIQHAADQFEIRLITSPDADRYAIEAKVVENLRWRAAKIGGEIGKVSFNNMAPERNPKSRKLIRVVRRF